MAYLKPAAIETKIFNRLAMMSALGDVHTPELPEETPTNRNGFR